MVTLLMPAEPLRRARNRRWEVIIEQTSEERDFPIPTLRIQEVLELRC